MCVRVWGYGEEVRDTVRGAICACIHCRRKGSSQHHQGRRTSTSHGFMQPPYFFPSCTNTTRAQIYLPASGPAGPARLAARSSAHRSQCARWPVAGQGRAGASPRGWGSCCCFQRWVGMVEEMNALIQGRHGDEVLTHSTANYEPYFTYDTRAHTQNHESGTYSTRSAEQCPAIFSVNQAEGRSNARAKASISCAAKDSIAFLCLF